MSQAKKLLADNETTGTEFGEGTDVSFGGGLVSVLIKDIGSETVTLQVEIDGDWTDSGNEWAEAGGHGVYLPAAAKYRFTTSGMGPIVLIAPIDRSARGPLF